MGRPRAHTLRVTGDTMNESERYWGTYKNGRGYVNVGPYTSRDEAKQAAFNATPPKLRAISTGRGNYGPHFDIRWHDREVTP